MSICDTNLIPQIESTQCIGNSLDIINTNFQTLKGVACANTNSIDTLNTKIGDLNGRIDNLSASVPGIARAWVKFSGRKGDDNVTDDGSAGISRGGLRLINSSYNVNKVTKDISDYQHGSYIIYVKPGVLKYPGSNVVVLGTSSEKTSAAGNYTWVQPVKVQVSSDVTSESLISIRVHGPTTGSTDTADPDFISVVMFSL